MEFRYAVMKCKRCGHEWPDEVPVGERDWTFWPVCQSCGFLRPRVWRLLTLLSVLLEVLSDGL